MIVRRFSFIFGLFFLHYKCTYSLIPEKNLKRWGAVSSFHIVSWQGKLLLPLDGFYGYHRLTTPLCILTWFPLYFFIPIHYHYGWSIFPKNKGMWLWWKNESILLIWSSARQPLGYCVLEIKLNHNGYRYGMWGALTDAHNDFILIPCCVVLVSYPLTAKWVNCRFILWAAILGCIKQVLLFSFLCCVQL